MENRTATKPIDMEKVFAITGTFHGSIVEAKTEGEARRIFHAFYNGESIIHIKKLDYCIW